MNIFDKAAVCCEMDPPYSPSLVLLDNSGDGGRENAKTSRKRREEKENTLPNPLRIFVKFIPHFKKIRMATQIEKINFIVWSLCVKRDFLHTKINTNRRDITTHKLRTGNTKVKNKIVKNNSSDNVVESPVLHNIF